MPFKSFQTFANRFWVNILRILDFSRGKTSQLHFKNSNHFMYFPSFCLSVLLPLCLSVFLPLCLSVFFVFFVFFVLLPFLPIYLFSLSVCFFYNFFLSLCLSVFLSFCQICSTVFWFCLISSLVEWLKMLFLNLKDGNLGWKNICIRTTPLRCEFRLFWKQSDYVWFLSNIRVYSFIVNPLTLVSKNRFKRRLRHTYNVSKDVCTVCEMFTFSGRRFRVSGIIWLIGSNWNRFTRPKWLFYIQFIRLLLSIGYCNQFGSARSDPIKWCPLYLYEKLKF